MNVYRIEFKTGVAQNLEGMGKKRRTINQIFEYCNKKHIIALGWNLDLQYYKGNNLQELTIDEAIEIRAEEKKANNIELKKDKDYKSFVSNMRCLKKIEKDDIVWTRVEGTYYVGKITNEKYMFWNIFDKENAEEFDVRHAKECYFYKVGKMDEVPGVIVNAFSGPSHTLCKIGNYGNAEFVNKYSKYIFNEKCADDSLKYLNANIDYKVDDFWQIIKDQEAEELVSLYLQKERNYKIFITTKRRSTPSYELAMVNDEGETAVVQVKTGKVVLKVEDYENENNFDKIFLFSTNKEQDKEAEKSTKKVEVINRIKLKEFVDKNHKILPKYLIDEFKLFKIL